MNHGIKIVRHTSPVANVAPRHGVIHVIEHDRHRSDEETIAAVLCMRLHDDEFTSKRAKECRTIHVWPGLAGTGMVYGEIMSPDPQCVIKRTAALEKWNGVGEQPVVACGEREQP